MLARHRRDLRDRADALNIIEAAEQHIQTMGRIHRKLVYSQSELDLPKYIQELCNDVVVSFGRDDIECDIQIKQLDIAPEQLTSVALLLFELLTNSFKHAFRDRSGRIVIRLERNGNSILFNYADTGPGFRISSIPKAADGLGTKLIQTFSSQLGGAANWTTNSPGFSWTLKFPVRPIGTPRGAV